LVALSLPAFPVLSRWHPGSCHEVRDASAGLDSGTGGGQDAVATHGRHAPQRVPRASAARRRRGAVQRVRGGHRYGWPVSRAARWRCRH